MLWPLMSDKIAISISQNKIWSNVKHKWTNLKMEKIVMLVIESWDECNWPYSL